MFKDFAIGPTEVFNEAGFYDFVNVWGYFACVALIKKDFVVFNGEIMGVAKSNMCFKFIIGVDTCNKGVFFGVKEGISNGFIGVNDFGEVVVPCVGRVVLFVSMNSICLCVNFLEWIECGGILHFNDIF